MPILIEGLRSSVPKKQDIEEKPPFAKMIFKARKQMRLSTTEVAERAGMSQSAVSGYENGMKPRIDFVEALAEALDLNLDEALLAAGHAPGDITDPLDGLNASARNSVERLRRQSPGVQRQVTRVINALLGTDTAVEEDNEVYRIPAGLGMDEEPPENFADWPIELQEALAHEPEMSVETQRFAYRVWLAVVKQRAAALPVDRKRTQEVAGEKLKALQASRMSADKDIGNGGVR